MSLSIESKRFVGIMEHVGELLSHPTQKGANVLVCALKKCNPAERQMLNLCWGFMMGCLKDGLRAADEGEKHDNA